jgi:hypothetical protein
MAKAETKEVPALPAKEYEPTQRELDALIAYRARKKRSAPAPDFKVIARGSKGVEVKPDHPDVEVASALLMNAIGTADFRFIDGLLAQLAKAAATSDLVSATDLNFALSVIKGIEPRDQLEAMLAAQMAAVHQASMMFAGRLYRTDNIQFRDGYERSLNRCARTYTTQMEALKRYRSTGEQKMTVEHQHVTVNEGGQAIVGNVTTGGGGIEKSEDQPHAKRITHAPGETVPSEIEAIKETVPRSRS